MTPAESISRDQRASRDARHLVPLAGATPAELGGVAHAALAWLNDHRAEAAWLALAHTLADRAAAGPARYRAVAVVASGDELRAALRALLDDGLLPRHGLAGRFSGRIEPAAAPPGKLAFIAAGGGTHWAGMGSALYAHDATFRGAIEACSTVFDRLVSWSLVDELLAPHLRSRVDEFEVSLVTAFSIGVALGRMLSAWGAVPDAIAGHSLGAPVAACLSGALSIEDAAQVVLAWAAVPTLVDRAGDMLAVKLTPEEAMAELDGERDAVSLAAVNSPRSITLAGDPGALRTLEARLSSRGVFARILPIGVAFHSHHLEPLRQTLLARLAGLSPRPPTTPLYTMGPGTAGAPVDAMHWWNTARNTVQLAGTVDRMIDDGHGVFWELSPQPVLNTSLNDCLAARDCRGLVLASLRPHDELGSVLDATGAFYAAGGALDWAALYRGDRHGRAALGPVEDRALQVAAMPSTPAVLRASDPAAWDGPLLPAVVTAAAEIMGRAPGDLPTARSWIDAGMESLQAVKLRAMLTAQLNVEIPLARLFANRSIAEFVADLERERAQRDVARPAITATDVDALPADAVDALLAQLVDGCPPDELAALLARLGDQP